MMTTDESEQHAASATREPGASAAPVTGGRVLGGAAALTLGGGVVLAAAAGLLSGAPAAAGAFVGAAIVATVMVLGTVPMNLVAAVMPRLSLAFALLTYSFQLMALIAALVVLDQSGLVGDELSRGWLGAALMLGVGCWVVAHIVLASRARIPVYDLDAGTAVSASRTTEHPRIDPGAR